MNAEPIVVEPEEKEVKSENAAPQKQTADKTPAEKPNPWQHLKTPYKNSFLGPKYDALIAQYYPQEEKEEKKKERPENCVEID